MRAINGIQEDVVRAFLSGFVLISRKATRDGRPRERHNSCCGHLPPGCLKKQAVILGPGFVVVQLIEIYGWLMDEIHPRRGGRVGHHGSPTFGKNYVPTIFKLSGTVPRVTMPGRPAGRILWFKPFGWRGCVEIKRDVWGEWGPATAGGQIPDINGGLIGAPN